MHRSLQSNSTAPEIYPFFNQEATMAAAAGAGAGPPAVAAPSVSWNENPLTGNFNPGTASGQKIFLEKTKGLDTDKRLALTNSNSPQILALLKVKEQVMGGVVTGIPTSYAGGNPSALMNLIT